MIMEQTEGKNDVVVNKDEKALKGLKVGLKVNLIRRSLASGLLSWHDCRWVVIIRLQSLIA